MEEKEMKAKTMQEKRETRTKAPISNEIETPFDLLGFTLPKEAPKKPPSPVTLEATLTLWNTYSLYKDLIVSALVSGGVKDTKWYYDEEMRRYRYVKKNGDPGRVVPLKFVKRDAYRVSQGVKQELREFSELYRTGEISLDDWYSGLENQMYIAYLASILAAYGGINMMKNLSDWVRFGEIMEAQYKYSINFRKQLAASKIPLNLRFIARTGQYGQAVNVIYEDWRLRVAGLLGYTEGRRFLSPAEHCKPNVGLPGCPDLAELGWVSIYEVVPIGSAACFSGCACTVSYR